MSPKSVLSHLAEIGTPPSDDTDLIKLSAGLQPTLNRFSGETLPFLAAGGSDIQFIAGPYGRGKTHFLKVVSQWAQQHGFVVAYVECREGQSPFKDLQETYRAIAADMVPPEGSNAGHSFTQSGVCRVIEASIVKESIAMKTPCIDMLQANPALSPDFRNLVLAYRREVVAAPEHTTLRERLEAMLSANSHYHVTLGELYSSHRSLPRPIGKLGKRNALIWLRSLLSLPRLLGYAGIIVCFDETETVLLRGTVSQRQKHLVHIRTFIDYMAIGAFEGCGVYYTVTDEFIDDSRTYLQALNQRIERIRLAAHSNNPRAVCVDLDELTSPNPRSPDFFAELAVNIVGVGIEAGLPVAHAERILDSVKSKNRYFASENISEGAVREYVKDVSACVRQKLQGW